MDWKSAFGAGAAAGAAAGMIASNATGQLGFAGAVIFFLFIAPIKPGGSKAMAMIAFVLAAALCIVLFRR